MQYIGKLDKEKFKRITENIDTNEVILTEKQVELTYKAGGKFIISPDTYVNVIKKTKEFLRGAGLDFDEDIIKCYSTDLAGTTIPVGFRVLGDKVQFFNSRLNNGFDSIVISLNDNFKTIIKTLKTQNK